MRDADFRTPPPDASGQKEKEDWIGRQLRRVFDTSLSEPLPDDIMSLLDRLDDAPSSSRTVETSETSDDLSSEGSKGAA